MSVMGTRVVRVEDPRLLSTGGVYTEDLRDPRLTGALHLGFVRSPLAHARVVSVDAAEALAAPGVVAVLTAADLGLPAAPPMMPNFNPAMTLPALAGDVVRYAGEPVVAVLCEDAYQVEDAVGLVDVEYEPLPFVVDMRAAARDEVLLFPEAGTNTVCTFGAEELDEGLFEGCEVVVTREIENQRVAVASMEGRAGAAVPDDDGRLTLWLSTQAAAMSQGAVAGWLGLGPEQVRVITPDVGGGFGAKIGADPEHVVLAAAARHVGRPVRWTETRSENLVAMCQGRAQVNTVTIGGTRDGKVLAYRLDVLQDAGAYPRFGAFLPALTTMMAAAVYTFPKIETRARSVVTNTTTIGAYRGAGRPEATHAIERGLDLFAAEIGMDPAEVRRRNLIPRFTEPHATSTGGFYDTGDYPEALDRALWASGYDDLRAEQARRRERGDEVQMGIGLCVYVEITGAPLGPEASEVAEIQVHADGTATVLTGTSPHGQGHATAWAMLAHEETGIPIEKITVEHGDTDRIPDGTGTFGSRSLQQGGVAVQQASIELVELARQRAAQLLEADPSDIVLDKDRAALQVKGSPTSAVTFAQLAEKEPLGVKTKFVAPGPTFPFGAHVAVVDVDTRTGKARLRRLIAVDDAGTVLNPLLCEGQRHGGFAQGAAQALMEEVRWDADGNPETSTFASYPFLSATEVPSFELVEMATPTTYNSLGAKGIGEAGTIGSTPAVHNAVVDAVAHLGVRHIDMPTTPQRVWTAIQEAAR
ncbi:xanthine dehydrogenase family protein molybdopterin-binding subunit [Pseudonocardia lacus]|uniref:xanthine dehydrogenase family protein molybdopterin-binding subunit n=1 Tax=Pseudonocardia lacus TaxID=2835865 RepID=UPI001BDCD3F7|nr:xanthine dehydrogenase family protein molybdopterin-binding subunit [Pseudonocardia lacus]